ncbi:MAG: hypothetical protein JO316_15590 [Abitibacteriaceae bacterium]|nr:hypothetical protein [Abditibacteriaceae bacterium]
MTQQQAEFLASAAAYAVHQMHLAYQEEIEEENQAFHRANAVDMQDAAQALGEFVGDSASYRNYLYEISRLVAAMNVS